MDDSGDVDPYDIEEEEHEEEVKEWDEGGKSHCGYSDGVHDTLMSIGKAMHSLFGEPSEGVQEQMKGIGGYFQEASYTVRDFSRGKLNKENFAFLENGEEEENDGEDEHSDDGEE